MKTDGHWPVYDRVAFLIVCECGERPKKRAARMSMQHVWHQSHRRRLRLQPVEYVWPDELEGLSSGGFVQLRGYAWRDGRWEQEHRDGRLRGPDWAAAGSVR